MCDPVDLHAQPLVFIAKEIESLPGEWVGDEGGGGACSYYTKVTIRAKSSSVCLLELKKALAEALKRAE